MDRVVLKKVEHQGVKLTEVFDQVEKESYGRYANALVAEIKKDRLEKAFRQPQMPSDMFMV